MKIILQGPHCIEHAVRPDPFGDSTQFMNLEIDTEALLIIVRDLHGTHFLISAEMVEDLIMAMARLAETKQHLSELKAATPQSKRSSSAFKRQRKHLWREIHDAQDAYLRLMSEASSEYVDNFDCISDLIYQAVCFLLQLMAPGTAIRSLACANIGEILRGNTQQGGVQ